MKLSTREEIAAQEQKVMAGAAPFDRSLYFGTDNLVTEEYKYWMQHGECSDEKET